ncbi:IS1595 family transposase [Desulfovibrio aminophilus]|nr:IS1595 family transposase [Desulfovibrio aminophilus]MCM0755976.1 IS1595 family transposase [Desulfovibrio aminophilus]
MAVRLPTSLDLARAASSEEEARALLRDFCFPDGVPFCPRCGERRVYHLAEGRMRCGGCRYTFQEFTGRWINNGGLSCRQWLRLAGLFAGEATAHGIAKEIGASYNATYKALTALRYALLVQALDARLLLGPATGLGECIRGRKLTGQPGDLPPGRVPVFGLIEEGGLVFVDLVPEIEAETVFHFHANFQLKLIRMNNIIYTDRYRRYHALVFCADESLPLRYISNYDRIPYVDAEQHGFWTFAQERIKRYKGLSPQRFPLYLKELEFRYNRRDQDLHRLFLEALSALVPDLPETGAQDGRAAATAASTPSWKSEGPAMPTASNT